MIYENLSEEMRKKARQYTLDAWRRNNPVVIKNEPIKNPIIRRVAELVCEGGLISAEQLKTRFRGREYTDPRQTVHYIVRMKFPEITQQLLAIETGLRNHTTVINSILAVQNRIDTDKEFKLKIENLIKRLL